MTGDISPDVTGRYLANGTHNGETAYQRNDEAYWLTWLAPTWIITVDEGFGDVLFQRVSPSPIGGYLAVGSSTGTPSAGYCLIESSSQSSSSMSSSSSQSSSSSTSSSSTSSSSLSSSSSSSSSESSLSSNYIPVRRYPHGKTVAHVGVSTSTVSVPTGVQV